jgi:hypothetical protein
LLLTFGLSRLTMGRKGPTVQLEPASSIVAWRRTQLSSPRSLPKS